MDNDELYRRCWNHLSMQHSVLWSESYDVSDENQRDVAANWLAGQIKAVVPEVCAGSNMVVDVRSNDDSTNL